MRTITWGSLAVGLILCCRLSSRADDKQIDPKAVIDKAIKALGGEEKLAKYKAATWKGKGVVHAFGEPVRFTGEWHVQGAQQMKNHVDADLGGQKFFRIQVVNGDKGWTSMPGAAGPMIDEQLNEAKNGMYSGWVTTVIPLKDPSFTLTSLGESKVGERPAVGVKVAHKDHKDINLYFDKETGLLIKSQEKITDIMFDMEVNEEKFYSDYTDYGGMQRNKKLVIKHDGKDHLEFEMTEFKPQAKLDDSVFAKPDK